MPEIELTCTGCSLSIEYPHRTKAERAAEFHQQQTERDHVTHLRPSEKTEQNDGGPDQ